jgi:hypothetical protein
MDSEVGGGIRFLHRQDGVPEREFMHAIAAVLQGSVRRAYLARVEYSDTGTGAVALCLRATGPEESLAKAIGAAFARMFGSSQHLDIVFLNDAQERQLERVCRPFFESAA